MKKEDDMNLADISKLGVANPFKQALRQLHRRQVRGPGQWPVLPQHHADHRPALLRNRALDRRGHRAGAGRRPRRKEAWGKTSPAERANILNRIADRIEAEPADDRHRRNDRQRQADPRNDGGRHSAGHRSFPLFRRLPSAPRKARFAQIDHETYAYHFHEPLGVVGQIIPWNFPILMAVWKLAPALAAGNCVVLKPAEQTPASIMVLIELIGDLLPPGVLNIVNGFGLEAGKPLASSKRIAKIAFTGETGTGRLIMQYAAQNLIPVTLELGGKSPNIFFEDVMDKDDAFFDKCLEGFAMFALNQGEVCTCPSRVLVQESIYDRFIERAGARGGDQAGQSARFVDHDRRPGIAGAAGKNPVLPGHRPPGRRQVLAGGERHARWRPGRRLLRHADRVQGPQQDAHLPGRDLRAGGVGHQVQGRSRALRIANDTLYGLGAGLWTRDASRAFRMGRAIQAGRVWTNCYHLYPAHAAFGGYKQSGIGRENHKMMLDHYQQTKNLLVSYSPNALGFF
jgi:aldehyde dehydrogenase